MRQKNVFELAPKSWSRDLLWEGSNEYLRWKHDFVGTFSDV